MDRAEFWRAMGQSQLQLGRPAQARHSFQRALAARKGRCHKTLTALAQCAVAENALEEALRLANEASALAPEDDGPAELACFILLKLGRFSEAAERTRGLLGQRPLEERIALLRKSLVGASSLSEGWNDLGVLLFRSGKTDEATDCFKKAYLSDPQNLNALENLIEHFIRLGKCEPAAALALQWTRSHPSCSRAWIAWAKLNLIAGESASAKAALTRALKIDPANAVVQSALESLESGASSHSTPCSAAGLVLGKTLFTQQESAIL
jgi:tetratricopeptide (TPR) repeat protein